MDHFVVISLWRHYAPANCFGICPTSLLLFQPLDIKKARLRVKQYILDKKKSSLYFGPDESSLPIISWKEVEQKIAKGDHLVVIDGIIHDISTFVRRHPGMFNEIS